MAGWKLTPDEVREIYLNDDGLLQADIADLYGVTKSTISTIWNRKSYKNLTADLPHIDRNGNKMNMRDLGEQHPRAKLTNEQVKAIWKSKKSQHQLALEYGVTVQNIYYLLRGVTWRYITRDLGAKGGGVRHDRYMIGAPARARSDCYMIGVLLIPQS